MNKEDLRADLREFENMSKDVETVFVRISILEAAMLRVLRQYPYGTFIVEKKKGQPRYVKPQGSEILSENDGWAFVAENLADDPK